MAYYLTFVMFLASGHATTGQAGPYVGVLACETAAGQLAIAAADPKIERVVTICTAKRVRALTWNGKELTK